MTRHAAGFLLALSALFTQGCSSGSSCELEGRWQGIIVLGRWSGTSIVQFYDAGGEYRLEAMAAEWTGTWSRAGDVVTIADGSCITSEAGQWELRWDDCEHVAYHIVDDPCESRGEALNGVVMTRPY